MIFKSNNFIKHLFLFYLSILFLLRCASTPPPPPPSPEPVVKKQEPPSLTPPSPPKGLKIQSVTYDRDKMVIEWEKSEDTDFDSYRLLQAMVGGKDSDTIFVSNDVNQTNFVLEKFDPTKENWFWIDVRNTTGLHTTGERKSNTREVEAPKSSSLHTMEGRHDLKIQWTANKDEDFGKYTIYRSSMADMKDKEKVKDVLLREDTIQVLSLDSVYFYLVETQDYWGLTSYSNVVKGDYLVKIWEEEYSIVQTKKIDLTSKKLFGTIPSEFGKLLNLEILLLQNNFLTGDLPEELWDLRKLRVLNISKNQFGGKIPVDIHKANAIQEIWFANNNFDGNIPHQIFTLKNLTHINLSSNNLSGNVSEAISNCEQLVYLNLYDNNLIGSIPEEIGQLKSLEFLSLGKNQLTGEIPPEIAGAIKLESIALFENQLIGSIPIEIMELKHLKYLGLFDNQLMGRVSNQIFDKSELSYLRLNNNKLEKVNYDSLCKSGYDWDNSIYFDLSDNDFKEKLPACFSETVFYEIYSSFKDKK